MIIYKLTNINNGKIYIGQTVDSLEKRINGHLNESNNNSTKRPLLNALKKYGLKNFKIEIIDTAETQEELDEKEIKWIESLKSLTPNGYNVLGGGQYRKKTTEEFGKLISNGLLNSEKWKKIKQSDSYQKKLKENFIYHNKGKKLSDEHKNKIWESNKERILNYNKSTSLNWIIVESNNSIVRLLGKEEYCKKQNYNSANLTRQSKLLIENKKIKRRYGVYCFLDIGQTDVEILSITDELDKIFYETYMFYNKKTNETISIKRNEFREFCNNNELDFSNFIKVYKGISKSYKGWVSSKNDTPSIGAST
jgi:group I intron endonuclease